MAVHPCRPCWSRESSAHRSGGRSSTSVRSVQVTRSRPSSLTRSVEASRRRPRSIRSCPPRGVTLTDAYSRTCCAMSSRVRTAPWRSDYARDVERGHGLPRAVRQSGPSRRYRSDVWYRDFGVIVELDGRLHHQGLAAFGDMSRDNLHRLRGSITLRFGWAHVAGEPCLVARQVAAALSAGGWNGSLTRCQRCAQVPGW